MWGLPFLVAVFKLSANHKTSGTRCAKVNWNLIKENHTESCWSSVNLNFIEPNEMRGSLNRLISISIGRNQAKLNDTELKAELSHGTLWNALNFKPWFGEVQDQLSELTCVMGPVVFLLAMKFESLWSSSKKANSSLQHVWRVITPNFSSKYFSWRKFFFFNRLVLTNKEELQCFAFFFSSSNIHCPISLVNHKVTNVRALLFCNSLDYCQII